MEVIIISGQNIIYHEKILKNLSLIHCYDLNHFTSVENFREKFGWDEPGRRISERQNSWQQAKHDNFVLICSRRKRQPFDSSGSSLEGTWILLPLYLTDSWSVSWCFEPSQQPRITSGLKINFNLSQSDSLPQVMIPQISLFFFSLSLSHSKTQLRFYPQFGNVNLEKQ